MPIESKPASNLFLSKKHPLWHFVTDPSSEVVAFSLPNAGIGFEQMVQRVADSILSREIPGISVFRAASDRQGEEAHLIVEKHGKTGACLRVICRMLHQGDTVSFELVRCAREALFAQPFMLLLALMLTGIAIFIACVVNFWAARIGLPLAAAIGFVSIIFGSPSEQTQSDLRSLFLSVNSAVQRS